MLAICLCNRDNQNGCQGRENGAGHTASCISVGVVRRKHEAKFDRDGMKD